MKKTLIAFAMFIFVAAYLFADDRLTITVGGAVDALYMRTFLGDYAIRDVLSETRVSPFMYQGDGIINAFQSSAFGPGIMGRFGFAFTGERLGGSMELRMRTDSEYSAITDWDAWFRLRPWADSFSLRILGGNTVQNGRIATHDNFDDFLKANIENFGIMIPVWRVNGHRVTNIQHISNFPYGYASVNRGSDLFFAQFYGTQTYDLFMPAETYNRRNLNLLADFIFRPFTITLATGGLFENVTVPTRCVFTIEDEEGSRDIMWDTVYDPASVGGMNFAFRVESAPIAGFLTVAAVYKHSSSFKHKIFDPTDLVMQAFALADITRSSHAYGLYFGLTLDTLNISLGYSGLHQTWTNPHFQSVVSRDKITDPSDRDNWFSRFSETRFPLYHGVDLRLFYTGVRRFTFTFNNNVSFARARGISSAEAAQGIYAVGWAYSDFLGNTADRFFGTPQHQLPNHGDGANRSELYLGLFNAIGVRYAISEQFLAEVSIASQLGRFSLDWEGGDAVSTTHYLGAYLGVRYSFFDIAGRMSATIRGGLDLRLSSFSHQAASLEGTMPIHTAGVFQASLPISVLLRF